ncbi:MAG: DUF898 family protein [Bacilli bacterium]|jgi:hypothetical protein|nr:DUF898 family protein [Bacilli bacterium]
MADEKGKPIRQTNGRFQKRQPLASSSFAADASVPASPQAELGSDPSADAFSVPSLHEGSEPSEEQVNEIGVSDSFVTSWGHEEEGTGSMSAIEEAEVPSPSDTEGKEGEAPAPAKPSVSSNPSVPEEGPMPAPKEKPVPQMAPAEEAPLKNPAPSNRFDGKPYQVLLNALFAFFVTALSLGIAFPWVYCRLEAWGYDHTVYEGKRVHFDGHGGQLIGKWVLWWFLSLITLTVFAWWLPLELAAWKVRHCHFVEA